MTPVTPARTSSHTAATSPQQRLEEAVLREAPGVLAYLTRRVADPADAADLLGDVLVVIWRRIDAMPLEPGPARMWIFGIARKTLAGGHRSSRRRQALTARLRHEISTTNPTASLPGNTQGRHTRRSARRPLRRGYDPAVAGRGWWLMFAASVTLALVSVTSNITTMAQLSAQADTLLAVRSTVSKLVNAGTVWAGLPVLAGWLIGRRVQAAAAGVAACLIALVVHYSVGQVLGQFDSAAWAENWFWVVLAVVVGGPLGLIGAAARRIDRWGLLARLVVPVGAVLEPFSVGMFTMPSILPWPTRVSSMVSGGVLLIAGTATGAAVLLRRGRRTEKTPLRNHTR